MSMWKCIAVMNMYDIGGIVYKYLIQIIQVYDLKTT